MRGNLSDGDHERLDEFLGKVFAAARAGTIAREDFVEGMAYVMTALDVGNRDEALFCFDKGIEHFKLEPTRRSTTLAWLRMTDQPARAGEDDQGSQRRRA